MKYMKWEDLEVGDKIRIRQEVIKWAHENFQGYWANYWSSDDILTITKIASYENVLHISVRKINTTNYDNSGLFIIDKSLGYEITAHCNKQPFFELIKLRED